MIELYQNILLDKDFPEYNLKKGNTATLVDIIPHPSKEEDGYVLEIFNDLGESIDVVIVPQSIIKLFQKDTVQSLTS
jgi:hypothetical protein